MKKSRAFTLIELLIVVGIIGILASVGHGMYIEYVRDSYRSEAQSALLQFQQAMERHFTENNSYTDTHAGGVPLPSVFPSQAPINTNTPKYDLTIATTTTSYTLTATPIVETIMEGDGAYTLTNTSRKTYNGNIGWNSD